MYVMLQVGPDTEEVAGEGAGQGGGGRFASLVRRYLTQRRAGQAGAGQEEAQGDTPDSFLDRLSFVAESEEETVDNRVSNISFSTAGPN